MNELRMLWSVILFLILYIIIMSIPFLLSIYLPDFMLLILVIICYYFSYKLFVIQEKKFLKYMEKRNNEFK